MQHDGWLETQLQARFPREELTIRNLGYSADELTIRLRSKDFGTPDEWLSRTKTDVILAFFGYNESFGDLNRFKQDLAQFITHTLGQKYNGQKHTAAGAVLADRTRGSQGSVASRRQGQ